MRLKNIDLIGAVLVALINVASVQIPDRPLALGIILALPLIFILPGYTLTQILFRKRSPDQLPGTTIDIQLKLKIGRPIGGVDQFILSLGLSMAIAILVGFVLNVLPIGLQGMSWAVSLGLITTCMALVAAFLRRKDFTSVVKMPGPRVAVHDYILFGFAILLVTVAVWASVIRPIQPQPSFTQFWMLPANQASRSCAVSLGIRSFEANPVTYHVVLVVNGVQTDTWSSISLSPHGEWTRVVTVKSETASSVSIQAQLYRVDKLSTAYRNVHLTFHASMANRNGQVSQQCTLGGS